MFPTNDNTCINAQLARLKQLVVMPVDEKDIKFTKDDNIRIRSVAIRTNIILQNIYDNLNLFKYFVTFDNINLESTKRLLISYFESYEDMTVKNEDNNDKNGFWIYW